MFDAGCNRMLLVDKPVVTCEAVSKLKVLLAGASNDDPIVKEAQRFEGGVDASETKFKTTTVGIVPSVKVPSGVCLSEYREHVDDGLTQWRVWRVSGAAITSQDD